ncbi:MAG: hypothetical protein ACP5DX_16735 [Paracoccaceae bacterium]
MMFNDGCWMRQLVVLAIATSLLTGCVTVGSDGGGPMACPPVVEYSRELQARAADELALLPEGSAIAEMLVDYAVMREQARVCQPRWETNHGKSHQNRGIYVISTA